MNLLKWAENHYWDSFEKDKDLIIKHLKNYIENSNVAEPNRYAVLGEVPNDVEDFIYKVLAVFEFIESGDIKKIDVIKKQANHLIAKYGLDK